MEKLKASINDILSKKSTIDWLIVHEISKLNPNVEDLEFSFVDGKERINEPFKTSQGYIYLKTHVSVTKFEKILVELCESIKANSFFFANLELANKSSQSLYPCSTAYVSFFFLRYAADASGSLI